MTTPPVRASTVGDPSSSWLPSNTIALAGEPYGVEAMAATSMLWDIIKQSGTGAGDAVREVSEVQVVTGIFD